MVYKMPGAALPERWASSKSVRFSKSVFTYSKGWKCRMHRPLYMSGLYSAADFYKVWKKLDILSIGRQKINLPA
ncbi:hypothetical protein GKZ89_20435 [Bacillus mangrovi]|uniref:Uncharacterized protein n=1 Tax=Metabacillus mangrovi TaxID=1491830 RepID=A0A7X2S9S5_9BACI|nr:hypothetical protein [Metabacillus mangrovi]MTH55763.1 hypothetical protein [Metabacillus mangrovi]